MKMANGIIAATANTINIVMNNISKNTHNSIF